jgi:hypothetical protein
MKGLAKDLKNCSFHLNNVCVGDTKKSAEKFSKLKLSISGVALRFLHISQVFCQTNRITTQTAITQIWIQF